MIQGRLQAAAQDAFHLSSSCQALFNEVAKVPFQLVDLVFLAGTIGGEVLGSVGIELSLAGNSGLVDPVSADGLGEDVESILVFFDDDVDVVAVTASGHRGVDTATVRVAVDEEEGGVDGASLGGVAGLGVAEFEILGHVVARKPDPASTAGEGDTAVGVDGFDGPVVAVLDHQPSVGAEGPVVAAGDHLVVLQYPPFADSHTGFVDVEFPKDDTSVLGEPVEPIHVIGAVGHQRHSLATASSLLPCVDDFSFHLFAGAAVEASPLLVFGEDVRVAGAEAEAGLAFPVMMETVDLIQLDTAVYVDKVAEHAAPAHG